MPTFCPDGFSGKCQGGGGCRKPHDSFWRLPGGDRAAQEASVLALFEGAAVDVRLPMCWQARDRAAGNGLLAALGSREAVGALAAQLNERLAAARAEGGGAVFEDAADEVLAVPLAEIEALEPRAPPPASAEAAAAPEPLLAGAESAEALLAHVRAHSGTRALTLSLHWPAAGCGRCDGRGEGAWAALAAPKRKRARRRPGHTFMVRLLRTIAERDCLFGGAAGLDAAVLVMRRGEELDLPGGKRALGETRTECALREFREECHAPVEVTEAMAAVEGMESLGRAGYTAVWVPSSSGGSSGGGDSSGAAAGASAGASAGAPLAKRARQEAGNGKVL